TINAGVPSTVLDSWDVEGADDLTSGQLKGMVSGNDYILSLSEISLSKIKWEKSQSNTNGIIDFFFSVKVEEGNADILVADIVDTVLGASFTDTGSSVQTDDFGVLTRVSGDNVTSIPGGFRVAEGDTTVFRVRYSTAGT